jgi:hypothetical protein
LRFSPKKPTPLGIAADTREESHPFKMVADKYQFVCFRLIDIEVHNSLTIGPDTNPKVEFIVNNALPRLTTVEIQ